MKRLGKIWRSSLFRISSLNAVSVAVKIGIGFVSAKVIAVFIGPSGMALLGNLRNFLSSADGISTLGFQNGIIKSVAEAREDEAVLKKLFSTVLVSLFVASIVLAALLLGFAEYLSREIFAGNRDFSNIFRIMAVALPLSAAAVFGVSIINGLGKFRAVIWLNIVGNVVGLLVSVLMIWKFGTFGALLSLILSPALGFFTSAWYVSKYLKIRSFFSFSYFDFAVLKNLGSFSAMALFSAIFVPLTLLAIRQNAIAALGIEAAGNWEAVNRISSYTLLFISTLVNIYFLPKMVLADAAGLRRTFWSYFRNILPLFGLGLAVLYFLRFFIISLLFTKQFLSAEPLFAWQLAGDFLKAASLVLGYCFFAKKRTKAYLAAEIFSLCVLYVSSVAMMKIFGLEGLSMAYCATYFVYFVTLVIYFWKNLFGSKEK